MVKNRCADAELVVYLQQVTGKPFVSDRIRKIIEWLISRSDQLDHSKLKITINIAGSSIHYELSTFDVAE